MRDIWWADLLRAVTGTGARSDTELAAVARLLGFGPVRREETPGTSDIVLPEVQPAAEESALDPAGRLVTPLGRDVATRDGPPVAVLEPITAEPIEATLRPGPVLPPPSSGANRSPLPHQSLLAPRSAPAIVQFLVSREVADGPPDVTAAVGLIAAGRPLSAVPCEPRPTLRFGAQVLIDLGEGMRPFRRDQSDIRDAVLALLGEGAADVLNFADAPLRGAGPGRRSTWNDYAPPESGRPVLLLTDFGIGGDPASVRRAEQGEWLAFFDLLRRHRCGSVALVPYPPARWPAALRARCAMLAWDRKVTVSHARAAVR
ncbi:hypothetical protein [Actinoplanes auranticolor]|uniref:Uncharacterized protein n=1 Tax=Actinoplanes auranticolor TaxID=47988 RepID=A0A919SSK4_9ACTN|nr:hypothetical protein [Actinoplanes auranticolor]GIM77585.1 hypothetical protein Aau02nite_76570 [Actinoplanes auranticolor]